MFPALPAHFPVLRRAGIVLREPAEGDAEAMFARLNDPAAIEQTSDEPAESLEQMADAVREMRRAFLAKERVRWTIAEGASGQYVGTVGFNQLSWKDRRGEIGYALAREWWGRGVATAAAGLAVDFGFEQLELNRVEATVMVGNDRSRRVLEKVGFRYEGRLQQYKDVRGTYRDFEVYALLRGQWVSQRQGQEA